MLRVIRKLFAGDDEPLGRRGEDYAARYLRKQKMKILDRNVEVPGGEIDILAQDGDELVFVEVRSRASESVLSPEGSIRRKKQEAMVRAARHIMQTRRIKTLRARIDAIAIVWPVGGGEPELRQHRGVLGLGRWQTP
jgi:putative endonuclease